MKIKLIITLAFFCIGELADAGPSCNRTYEFLGLTKSTSDIFWISSFSDGECQDYRLYTIVIPVDSFGKSHSPQFPSVSAACAKLALQLLDREDPVTISDSSGGWIKLDSIFSIKRPTTPKHIKDDYSDWAREVALNGWFWNRRSGTGGIVLPDCKGDSLDLIAIDSFGLYLDYTIDKVLYFTNSGYVLVFTLNPMYHDEFDSENGFLLMRRKRP